MEEIVAEVLGGKKDGLVECNGQQHSVESLREAIAREQLDSRHAFDLVQKVWQEYGSSSTTVVEDVGNVMVGVVVGVFVGDSNLTIDLKNGKSVKLVANANNVPKVDVRIQYESEQQFRGVLSKRIDFQSLMKTNQVKVEGSLRAKMKLMPLMDIGKKIQAKIQQVRNEQVMKNVDWTNEPTRGTFKGYLEKKSEWLRQWNERYFILEWDPFHRPVLSYSEGKSGPMKASFELHSSCTVEARVTTRRDKSMQYAFAVVDLRSGKDIVALCAPTEEIRATWLAKIKGAVTARIRERTNPAAPKFNTATAVPPPLTPTKRKDDKLSLAPSVGMAEDQVEVGVLSEERTEHLHSLLISKGVETNLGFILRKLSWRLIPILFGLNLVWERLKRASSRFLPKTFQGQLGLAACTGLLTKIVMEHKYFELFRRRMTVYMLAIRMIGDLKITEFKTEDLPPIHSDACWNVKQTTVAEEVYHHSLRLGGLWIKVAQHLGSRPDVFPPTITNVLGRLQDEVPPTPFDRLKPFLEEQFEGKRLEDLFSDFDPEPIAAASIGQVHLATLKEDGSRVVVKVQHPNIEERLTQDVYNMGVVMQWVALVDNKLDLGPILDHWRLNVLKELDFQSEMKNMETVGDNLRKSGPGTTYATVPTSIVHLCSKRVMVMRFVNGVKLTDDEALKSVGITGHTSRGQLADDLCKAFAHQIFIDGVFNSDPHPGNVLISRRCDIENGQVKFIPSSGQSGAKSDRDQNEIPDPDRPVPVLLDFGLTQYLPEKIRLGLAKLVVAGANLDAGLLMSAGQDLGIVLTREDILQDAEGFLHVFRNTAPPEESRKEVRARIEIEKEKLRNGTSGVGKVESFPPELLLFFRSINLLRGLCSALEVRQPFVKTLADSARAALLARYQVERPLILGKNNNNNDFEREAKILNPLEVRLREAIEKNEGNYLGVQLAVYDGTHGIAINLAKGRLSIIDDRPVNKDTLFPASSLGQSVAQLAAHIALSSPASKRSLDTFLEQSNVDLKAILDGDLSTLPIDPTLLPEEFSSKVVMNWKDHTKFVERVLANQKSTKRGKQAGVLPFELSHVSFFWGWLMMLIAQKTTAQDSMESVLCEIAKSKMDAHFGFENEEKALQLLEEGKIAQLSFPVEELLEKHFGTDVGGLGSVMDQSTTVNGGSGHAPGLSTISELIPSLKGKEFWIDPRMCNFPKILAAPNPSNNVSCTAKSLAQAFHALSNEGRMPDGRELLSPQVAKEILELASFEAGSDPFTEDKVGLRGFTFTSSKKNDKGDDMTIEAIGQIAFGGSLVLTFPSLDLTISILVNSLTIDRDFPQALLNTVYAYYGLSPNGDY